MGFDDNKEGGEKSENEKVHANQDADDGRQRIGRQTSETSLYATDQEDEDDEGNKLQLGPQFTLKEQLEKDKVCCLLNFKIKAFWIIFSSVNLFVFVILPLSMEQDDESLRRWKEQLLGSVDLESVGGFYPKPVLWFY